MARAKPAKSTGMGQKVETLWYDVEQMVGEDEKDEEGVDSRKVVNRKVAIDLFLQKQFNTADDRPAPAETIDLSFTLHCAESGDTVHGFDVRAMLKEMRGKLDHRFKIKWADYFIVRVGPARSYDGGIGTGLSFSYDTIERGVALDGSVLMRRMNHYSRLHDRAMVIEPWPKDVKENGRIVATVIASEENRARLELFQQKIDLLRKALAAMVTPQRLEETLLLASQDEFLMIGNG